MSKETGRKYGDQPSRPIYVWNGVLEPKHRKRIGPAIWLFLYFIDRTTKERPNKNNPEEIEGWVYGKMPLTLERMAAETGIPQRTISRYMATLQAHDYIHTTTAPHGLIILVQKSSKWPNGKKGEKSAPLDGSAKSGEPLVAKSGEPPAISGEPPAKSGERRKDKAVDLSGDERIRGHNTAHSACALPPSDSNSESQPQENCNPNPETLLTRKTPRPYTEALLRDGLKNLCAVPKAKRKAFTEAEIQEQLRIVRERYPEQFANAGKAATA